MRERREGFLPSLALTILLTAFGTTLAQDCANLVNSQRDAVVSITVDIEKIETGETRKVYGSGFIITSDGYLLTAYHVVSGDPEWKVNSIKGAIGSINGQYTELRYVTKDRENKDIALLQFKDANSVYSTVRLGKPANVGTGRKLCSLGYSSPLGLDYMLSEGNYTVKKEERWVAALSSNLGESGSPVFNSATGRVVAMKYGTLLVGSVPAQNVALLTPLNFAKTMLIDICELELTDN